MGFVGKNPRFETEILTNQGTTSISNSPSGTHRLINRNGVIYVQDSSGVETPSGGGAGEINVIGAGASTSSGWVASGAGVTVATSTTSSDLPLSGVVSTALKLTPVSGTDYARYRFTMPEALKNMRLKISFFQRPLSGYASGDIKLELYKNSASNYGGTYTEFDLSTDSSGTTSLPNQTGEFTTSFTADSADYYELRLVRVAGTTAINFAQIIIGPGIQPQGGIVGEWTDYTPTLSASWGTTSGLVAKYVRVGSSIRIKVYFVSGTTTAAVATISLPTGLTFGTMPKSAYNIIGRGYRSGITSSTGSKNYSLVAQAGDSTFGVSFSDNGTSSTTDIIVPQNANALANGDAVHFESDLIPISQWAGSGTLNTAQNDVEYLYNSGTWDATDTTSFAYGPQGVLMGGALTAARTKTVRSLSPGQVGDEYALEFANDGTNTWVPVGSRVGTGGVETVSFTIQNTTSYGATIDTSSVTSTDIIVRFGQYSSPSGATYGAAGAAWPSNVRWRVVKKKTGVAVGFGIGTSAASGLVPAGVVTPNETGLDLQPTTTPANPTSSSDVKLYVKGGKFIMAYNDTGTVRYKYLDMTGTGVTWVHTTSAP